MRSVRRRVRWAPRRSFLAILLLAFATVGLSVARAAPLPGPDAAEGKGANRWDRELERRQSLLARHGGRDPAAILAILGVLGDLHGDVDDQRLHAFLSKVADDKRRHPLVVSYARYLMARMHEAKGKTQRSAKALAAEGYGLSWQIVGPFDNSGRNGETAVFAPQTEAFAPDQVFSGKLPSEPLAWRAWEYADAPRAGYVSFDDRLRPNRNVTGYATAWVRAPKPMNVAVHLGSGGPAEVWVDGTSAGSTDGYRVAHPLQNTMPARLAAGWNRVLVKVSAQGGMWGFFLRFSDPGGAAIDGLAWTAEPPTDAKSAPGESTSSHKVVSLRAQLEAKFGPSAAGRKAAGSGQNLIEFYWHTHPFDNDDSRAVETARRVEGLAKTARSAWLLALVDRDAKESLAALGRGIARARGSATVQADLLGKMLLESAWRHRAIGLDDRFADDLDAAFEAAPFDPVVELALIDRAAEQGLVWWSTKWLSKVVQRNPESRSLRLELASRLRAQGKTQAALDTLSSLGQGPATAGHTIEALLDLGKPDDAVELARRAAKASPGVPDVHVTVARLEEARGDTMASRAAWAKALALAPHDAELHAQLGRVLARASETGAASASLRRSLELKPQQPEVRDLLAALDRSAPDDLFARYGVNFSEVAKTPTPKTWAGRDSGILRHRVAVKVLPNGLTERLDHRIIRVLDDRGVRTQAIQALNYDPAESIVEVRRARVRRANGTIEEIADVHVVALASAGYRMYYDQRQVRAVFGGLSVGDTIEVAFLQRDVAARNMFDEYFGDIMPVQGTEPRKLIEYILEAPRDKPIYFNLRGVEKKDGPDDSVLYSYSAKDVEAIKPEAGMPGWTEIATYLHASTYKTWNDVGDWYWDLVREQLVVDEDVEKAVAEALEGLAADATTEQKVAAIYTYVVRNTRYVGLEFGIHGFKPYRTTEVLSRRFGDCKDKASLLKVMLGEAGVNSHLVLVRTRDQGVVPAKPASLAVFNHAITYVPDLDLFLDGTAEWSGPTELPAGDQGASVLVVEDGAGAKFRKIPVSAAKDNLRRTEQLIKLAASGAARVEHTMVVTGASAAGLRFRFASAEARKERVASAFGDLYSGSEVVGVQTPGIGDITTPPRLEVDLRVPEWGNKRDDAVRFRVLGRPSSMASSLAPLSKREHDLVLDVPSTEAYALDYALPSGHRFARVPSAAKIESPLGKFELTVTQTPSGAKVRSELTLRKQRIKPSEYPAFRKFLQQVDAKLEQEFEVVPAK